MNGIPGFLAGTALLLWFSRKPLRAPGSHGFYRFFAWEAILLLFVLNHGVPPAATNSAWQAASAALMLVSIPLAGFGLLALRRRGQAGQERDEPGFYAFERTTTLVSSGLFKYIRHPMYTSLLALAWGLCLEDPNWLGVSLALVASGFLLLTAKADEKECLGYFGAEYAAYRQRTWMFVPFLL
ncbi:MAG: methyltransferase family protein [Bacteroidota bacterium]